MSQQLATQQKPSALRTMAGRLNVEAESLLSTLKATVCKGCSDAEVMAFSIVANEYNLNPFIKQIYAFPAKGGGIVPVVSVDGWITMTNNHPQMDGIEFEDEHDEKGNLVSIACTIYRKDRSRPIRAKEYLEECRRPTDPWKMPHRMLRHKALIQTSRIAFGFSGITDEDEADDIARNGGMRDVNGRVVGEASSVADRLREAEAAEATVDPAPAQAEPKAPRQRRAAAPKEAEAPAPEEPAPTRDPDMPSRVDMVAAIKESWREAEISMAQAEAIYRAKGLLGEMKKMADLTDAEVFDIFNNRGVVFNAGGAQ
jgi:phage recombination protein Bet